MTESLRVDLDHVRRSGVRFVDYGRDLSDLNHRLQAETAAGPRWVPEAGRAFTATFEALTQVAFGKADLLARNLQNHGLDLRNLAKELEASDERARRRSEESGDDL